MIRNLEVFTSGPARTREDYLVITAGQVQTDVIYRRDMKQDFPGLGFNPDSIMPCS
jgi:hypothetical protein